MGARGGGWGRGWGQGALLQLPPAPALLLAPAPLLSEQNLQAREPTGAAERGRSAGGAGMGAVLQLPLAHALPPHTYSPAVRATAQHGGQGRQPTGAAERGSRAGEAGGGDGVRHPVQLLQLSCFCSPPVPPS